MNDTTVWTGTEAGTEGQLPVLSETTTAVVWTRIQTEARTRNGGQAGTADGGDDDDNVGDGERFGCHSYGAGDGTDQKCLISYDGEGRDTGG